MPSRSDFANIAHNSPRTALAGDCSPNMRNDKLCFLPNGDVWACSNNVKCNRIIADVTVTKRRVWNCESG